MGNKTSAPAAPAASMSASASPSSGGGGSSPSTTSVRTPRPIPKHLTLLRGCTTLEQHEHCIRRAIADAKGLDGDEGLRALGFEFRFVPCCSAHDSERDMFCSEITIGCTNENANGSDRIPAAASSPDSQSPNVENSNDGEKDLAPLSTATKESLRRMEKSTSVVSLFSNTSSINEVSDCQCCTTSLFFVGRRLVSSGSIDCKLVVESSCHPKENAGEDSTEQMPALSEPATTAEIIEQELVVAITPTNRQQYIADGIMYELVANLAQQAAHSRMIHAFNLEWVTVCDEDFHSGKEPVRALVDQSHRSLLEEGENRLALHELLSADAVEKEEKKQEDIDGERSPPRPKQRSCTLVERNKTKSTLLIATGRGKVRAGIFSRHHLLTAGIEAGTSWNCILEARKRNWGVAIIDPNARGEEAGYESFKRSVSHLFMDGSRPATVTADNYEDGNNASSTATTTNGASGTVSAHSIYILAHSASGGQLVRHLREDPALLPSIRAIAFTDSTHSVQWVKHNPTLQEFLQRENCVYLRSNDVRSSHSCVKVSSRGKDIWCDCASCVDHKKSAGAEADTDGFWRHRFGQIKTLWAGTADHALSNWAGHESIWNHFDEQHASSISDGDSW